MTFFLDGCSSTRKRTQLGEVYGPFPTVSGTDSHALGKQEELLGPPAPYGPNPQLSSSISYGPNPDSLQPVVLVFGPGLARGFAYAGVLRALEEAKIPIGAIVASEMGGLIGVIYGLSESLNRFEWALQRLKEEDLFLEKSEYFSAFSKNMNDGKKLEVVLKKILGIKKLEKSRIPIHIILEEEKSEKLIRVSGGSAVDISRASVSFPSLFQGFLSAFPMSFGSVITSAREHPFPISEAKLLGIGPVIAINLLNDDFSSLRALTGAKKNTELIFSYMREAKNRGESELKEADFVLQPDMSEVGFLDFKKKNESVFLGKDAVQVHLDEINQRLGLRKEPLIKATP